MKELAILTAALTVLLTVPAFSNEAKLTVPADKNAEGEMIDADKAEDFFVAEFSEDLTAKLRPMEASDLQ